MNAVLLINILINIVKSSVMLVALDNLSYDTTKCNNCFFTLMIMIYCKGKR